MRDWSRAYRRASFRGVRFWIEKDGPDGGRRVAIHEVSGGDVHQTEDLGRRADMHRISAYVASDLADIEGLALEAACKAPGPSMLVLPMDLPLSAHCVGIRRNRDRDENGIVAYDLAFVAAGGALSGAASPLGALRVAFSANLGQVSLSISGVFR